MNSRPNSPTPSPFPPPFPPSGSLRLEGQGLHLREWDESDDVPALVKLYDDPQISRWTPVPSPFDAEAAGLYLAAASDARAEGRRIQLAITTDGMQPQGEILLFRSDVDARDIELAYGIGPQFRRQGLATRAVRLATDYALRQLAPRRVLLRIEAANVASEAVAKAASFRLTGDEPVLRDSRGRQVLLRTWAYAAE